MKEFVLDHNLAIITVLGAGILLYTLLFWQQIPILQRCIGLFDAGIIVHLWEEGRFPGGFTQMITERLHFTQLDSRFGGFVTALLVVLIGFVPYLFPDIAFLVFAAVALGYIESLAHIVAIRIFKRKRPYTPGMASALVILLPISIYTTWYLIAKHLMQPLSWLFAVLYLLVCVAIAQQIVVRSNGMKYSEFLDNVRSALKG